MAISDDEKTLHLPARDVPIPMSVSDEAQAVLAMGPVSVAPAELPALDDVAGWKAYVAEADAFMWSMVGRSLAAFTGTVETRDLGAFAVHVATPEGVEADDRRVYLDIHGGAWITESGDLCRRSAATAADQIGTRTWSVDYRMPPDHPYPTPLDDCLAAYRALLDERDPGEIVVGGVSAGGNLAAALVLRLGAEGMPLPAGLVLNTGVFDLTGAGDSRWTNDGLDNLLRADGQPCERLYAGGHDRRDPYLSPVYGDLTGFPPTILLTGTRDLLLSDNVRMHRALRAAGVDAELHVWEAASHGGFLGMAPEDADRTGELRRFAHRCWRGAAA
jgi:monoterpene epsilon-lactone hydrolase